MRLYAALAISMLLGAAPQATYDRDASAREYVQFLVLQLEQWRQEFPQEFYMAVMKPPVDASKIPDTGKAAAGEFGDSIKQLSVRASAKDVLTNADFRAQLDKTLALAKEVNAAMGAQRFPSVLLSHWDQIRSTLNNLARIYKLEMLAVLEPPGSGAGRGTRTQQTAGGLSGYIVDLVCAKRGKGMWANAECVARCVRDGDKIVLVTEEGKVYQIANPEKITPESYGQIVTLTGKTEGDTIRIDSLKL
jgi:hypothetical protein